METGMMSAQPTSQNAGYSGTVDVAGKPIEVKNGVAEVQGKQFFVSVTGDMVADEQGRLVGFIENGVFKKNTNEHLKMLMDKGLIQEGGK